MPRQPQRRVQTQQVRQQVDRLWMGLTQAWRQAVVLSRPITQDILADIKKGILWSDRKMNEWLKGRTTRSNRNLIKTCIRVGIAIVALLLVQVTMLLLVALVIGLGVKSVVRLNQLPTVNDEKYDDYQDP